MLAVIIGHPLRKVAGATNAGRELSAATAELVDVDLAAMWDRDEAYRIGKLNVRHVRSTHLFGPLAAWLPRFIAIPLYRSRIPELIREGEYDIVHMHNLVPGFAAEDVARNCTEREVPLVISSHGFNELSRYAEVNEFGPLKRVLADFAVTGPFRRTVRAADAIFALSDREEDILCALGVDRSRVHVVTNGVNEFYLDPAPDVDLDHAGAKFGIGSDPVLFFMGSLHRYKGVDVFLEALKQVKAPFQAVVGGQFRSRREQRQLLEGAKLPGELASQIVFTGALSNEELRALYNLADIFVYPTQADTLPLVVLEAMACGCPVVSTSVGGIPYAVQQDQGILVPPGDPGAVASAVNQLLADPARREEMGGNAAARVRQEFRWANSAARAVEAYRSVLGSRLAHIPA